MPAARRQRGTVQHRPVILVSNDDGIAALGLRVLAKRLRKIGRVVVVAPDQQRSASSHSLTLHRPLRMNRLASDIFAIDGTPTDCINLAVNEILPEYPDLIVSGINHGANLGDDVHYSGTVSAAVEGGILKIPSIAISAVGRTRFRFQQAADFCARLASRVLQERLPNGIILNVNVPAVSTTPLRGYAVCALGKRDYGDVIVEKLDPRGKKYYWIGGDEVGYKEIPHTDCSAILEGKISITPLRVDMTDQATLKRIRTWNI